MSWWTEHRPGGSKDPAHKVADDVKGALHDPAAYVRNNMIANLLTGHGTTGFDVPSWSHVKEEGKRIVNNGQDYVDQGIRASDHIFGKGPVDTWRKINDVIGTGVAGYYGGPWLGLLNHHINLGQQREIARARGYKGAY